MPQRTAGYIFGAYTSGSVVLVKGKARRFRLEVISLNGIGYYTQETATDVDELYRRQLQLEESSRKLERAGRTNAKADREYKNGYP